MKRKAIADLIAIVVIVSVAAFSGCIEEGTLEPTPYSSASCNPLIYANHNVNSNGYVNNYAHANRRKLSCNCIGVTNDEGYYNYIPGRTWV
jgi:hypothetical protein